MRRLQRGWLFLGLLVACQGDPQAGSWRVTFECAALGAAADSVRVRLLKGGCEDDADELYSAQLGGGDAAPRPPELPSGSYGFQVDASDSRGRALGSVCEVMHLPSEREVVLDVPDQTGLCADAGSEADAGDEDGGVEPGPREPSCADNLRDGDETDVDCGGPDCGPCNDRDSCLTNEDCKSLVCANTQCREASCEDRVKSGTETDRDCGGLFCPPCEEGQACMVATDCATLGCEDGKCLGPACDDELKNGTESDVDCGGDACDPCQLRMGCKAGTDCESGACDEGVCVIGFCLNDVLDSGETDVDCGGASCAPCMPGEGCKVSSDCTTGICAGGKCQVFQPFGYAPANFDPTGLDPTLAPAMSVLDCGATVFDTDSLELTNWCGEVEPVAVARAQSTGPDLAILVLRGLQIAQGSLLRIQGSRAAVLAVHGDARIDGDVDAAGGVVAPGPGGNWSCGASAGAPGGDDLIFWTQTGGGGGGGHRTAGGVGGNGDNTRGGAAGAARGGAGLSPLLGGCQGGRAGSCPAQLYGGAGGGALQISVAGSLVVNGHIVADGGPGLACPGNQTGGSGGGSGGSISLEGESVQVFGQLSVNGGRGGDGVLGGAGGAGGTTMQPPGGGVSAGSLGGGGGGGGASGYVRTLEHGGE